MATCVAWPPLLFALCAAGSWAAPDVAIPVRSEEGRRLQATDLQDAANSLGASLDAIHLHRLEDDALIHVRHPVDQPLVDPSGRRMTTMTRRDIVRMFMHLNVIAYGSADPYSEEVMGPILSAGDSLYGAAVDTYAKEVSQETTHMNKWKSEFAGNYTTETGGTNISGAGLDSLGVQALEFTIADLGKVLVFRGSYSSGDFDNIKLWVTDWIVRKMTAKMKYQWLTLAGLQWSSELDKDKGAMSGFLSQQVLYVGSWWYGSSFLKKMEELAKGTGGLVDPDKVVKTGYWEFTKLITNSVRKSMKSTESLYLSGHSQGGARAALASMYLKKAYNETREAITFAAVGGQCFSRDFSFTDASLTSDLDPYVFHSQITEYVHPLDIYGMFDYDVGTRCVYGLTGIESGNPRKYCEKIFGHQGSDLMVASQVGSIGETVAREFSRCRYFTHAWMAMDRALMDDNFIYENGTTDGGCAPMEAIPASDPDSKCGSSTAWFDGCGDELSCAACQVSTSATGLFSCYWCASTSKCVSGSAFFVQCDGGYAGPKDECGLVSAARGAGGHRLVLFLLCLLSLVSKAVRDR